MAAKIAVKLWGRWIDAGLPRWYTEKRSFLRGFQQLAAAALQPADVCLVFPKETSRFPCQRSRLEVLSPRKLHDHNG